MLIVLGAFNDFVECLSGIPEFYWWRREMLHPDHMYSLAKKQFLSIFNQAFVWASSPKSRMVFNGWFVLLFACARVRWERHLPAIIYVPAMPRFLQSHQKHFNDFRQSREAGKSAHHHFLSKTIAPLAKGQPFNTHDSSHTFGQTERPNLWLTCAHHIGDSRENNTHFWAEGICDFFASSRTPFQSICICCFFRPQANCFPRFSFVRSGHFLRCSNPHNKVHELMTIVYL